MKFKQNVHIMAFDFSFAVCLSHPVLLAKPNSYQKKKINTKTKEIYFFVKNRMFFVYCLDFKLEKKYLCSVNVTKLFYLNPGKNVSEILKFKLLKRSNLRILLEHPLALGIV